MDRGSRPRTVSPPARGYAYDYTKNFELFEKTNENELKNKNPKP
jgi:hypothetical protein